MQNPTPHFIRSLNALSNCIAKAETLAEAKRLKPDVIPNLRLVADMFPLARQVMIATDHAKGASARLAGLEVPSFEDTETTLPELRARIEKTTAFLENIPSDAFHGAEDRMISFKAGPRELTFPAPKYLYGFAIPNFYFHMTTAYNILRSNGVDIGKVDFLGGLDQ
ncbi:MAG: DUF1993 domain-containing protein [Cypionkella sp.]|nr:DUF1993 domain-containing protein [Cypionkella sp.]